MPTSSPNRRSAALPLLALVALSFLAAFPSTPRAQTPLRILWLGNSYSATMTQRMADLATEIGEPVPTFVTHTPGGSSLQGRVGQPTIPNLLAASSQPFDVVVMQGHSLEATSAFSNQTSFANAVHSLFTTIRAHSPQVRLVLYQTWARGVGHSFYGQVFSGPDIMATQIRVGYAMAAIGVAQTYGSDAVIQARAGQAFQSLGWTPALYAGDLSHPSSAGRILAALTLFEQVFERSACELAPDFATMSPTPLVAHLNLIGIGAGLWQDAVETVHALRPLMPGTEDDVRLRTTVNGIVGDCGIRSLRAGDTGRLDVESPNGTYDGVSMILASQVHATFSPPNPLSPVIWIDPAASTFSAFAPVLLTAPGWSLSFTTPAGFVGTSATLQAAVLAPGQVSSAFAATNAIELRFI